MPPGPIIFQVLFPNPIESAREVEKLAPQTAESYIALANALARAGQQEEAITGYQQALKIKPSHPGAFSGLGHQLKTVGRQQESIEVYRQYIAANPRNTEPYWSLANMKTFRFEDAEVGSMEELLLRLGTTLIFQALPFKMVQVGFILMALMAAGYI